MHIGFIILSENSNDCIISHFQKFVKKGHQNMNDDPPELIILRQKVADEVMTCTDPSLLDLISKLLTYDNGKNKDKEAD